MLDDLLLAVVALVVAAWLGASAAPKARLVLCVSALLISAALFLPLTLLRASVPLPVMAWLDSVAHALHANVPELAHLLIFSWLALALWTLRPEWRGWRTITVLLMLAIGSELMQGLTVERHPRLSDVGVDLAAEAVGLLLAIAVVALSRAGRDRAVIDPAQPDAESRGRPDTALSAATTRISSRSGRE